MSAHLTLVAEHGRRVDDAVPAQQHPPAEPPRRERQRRNRSRHPWGGGWVHAAWLPGSPTARKISARAQSSVADSGSGPENDTAGASSVSAVSAVPVALRGDRGAVTAEYAIVILAIMIQKKHI